MDIRKLFRRKASSVAAVLGGRVGLMESQLSIRLIKADGTVVDYGVVAKKKVTVAFVNNIVDALQGLATPYADFNDYKWHDYGIGTTGESNADTILENDCGEAREVGTQIEGATANIYKSVATHTFAGTFAITEHGLFNVVTANTPVLMDRSVFAAINVGGTDKIESTYQLTINAEA